jgi:hypothetical protein
LGLCKVFAVELNSACGRAVGVAYESAAKPVNVMISRVFSRQAEEAAGEEDGLQHVFMVIPKMTLDGMEIHRLFSPGNPVDEIRGHHRRLGH